MPSPSASYAAAPVPRPYRSAAEPCSQRPVPLSVTSVPLEKPVGGATP